jgi:hypothetical protein
MSKIIKKSDITTLVESTMKQAGILKEDMNGPEDIGNHGDSPCDGMDIRSEEYKECMGDTTPSPRDGKTLPNPRNPYVNKDGEYVDGPVDESDDVEGMEIEESDIVAESVTKLAKDASKHNTISENLKKDLASFNKIINYKY